MAAEDGDGDKAQGNEEKMQLKLRLETERDNHGVGGWHSCKLTLGYGTESGENCNLDNKQN